MRDEAKAKQQFGPYVEAIGGGVRDGAAVQRAMRGARALVVTGRTGEALRVAAERGVEHVVLASCTGARSHTRPHAAMLAA